MIMSNKDPKTIAAIIVGKKPEYDSMKSENESGPKRDELLMAFEEFEGAMKEGKSIKAMQALKAFVELCSYENESESND